MKEIESIIEELENSILKLKNELITQEKTTLTDLIEKSNNIKQFEHDRNNSLLIINNMHINLTRNENYFIDTILKEKTLAAKKDYLCGKIFGYVDTSAEACLRVLVSRLRRKIHRITEYVNIRKIENYGYQLTIN